MTPVDRSKDCWTCGFPSLRRGGHAEWCERVTARLAISVAVCSGCGKDFGSPQALGGHWSRRPCTGSASAYASSSSSSATGVEGGAHGAAGPSPRDDTRSDGIGKCPVAAPSSARVPNGTSSPAAPTL